MQPYVIILAGGKGSRLWPLSRIYYPKPFIRVLSAEHSLFQQAVLRALEITNPQNTIIVVNRAHAPILKRQIAEIGVKIPEENILLEPIPRDTLPAVIHALLEIPADAPVVLMPSDQYIKEKEVLVDAINRAIMHVDDHIVAIGVKPTEPYTGYGYIQPGGEIGDGVYHVVAFREKPDAETARKYVESGYLWNTFIHIFRKSVMLHEIKQHAPELLLTFQKYKNDADKVYPIINPASLSSDILERTEKNAVIPVELTWSDVGTFELIHKLADKDEHGNAYTGELVGISARRNFVHTHDGKTVVLIGLEDTFIVDTPDALIVGKTSRSQEVKTAFKILEEKSHPTTQYHHVFPREWGEVNVLSWSEHRTVASIRVLPRKVFSIRPNAPTTFVCTAGEVMINGRPLKQGDSVHVEADEAVTITNGDFFSELVQVSTRNGKENIYEEILRELEG